MLPIPVKTVPIVHDNIIVYPNLKFPVLTQIYELIHYKKLIELIQKCNCSLVIKYEENLSNKRIDDMEELLVYKTGDIILSDENKRLKQEVTQLKATNKEDEDEEEEYHQLQIQITNLKQDSKTLAKKQEKLEFCITVLRRYQIIAKEKIDELAIMIHQLKSELHTCLGNLELEKEKTSRLEDEVCDLLEEKAIAEEKKELLEKEEKEKEEMEMEKKSNAPMPIKGQRKRTSQNKDSC